MGSFHNPFPNNVAAPGTMISDPLETSPSSDPICKFRQEVVDECPRAKIILMHVFRDIFPTVVPTTSADGHKIDCPFIRCCEKFSNHLDLIYHMTACSFYQGGEYKCPDCNKYERFSVAKHSCSLWKGLERKEGVLKRLSRRLSGKNPRSPSPSFGKKSARVLGSLASNSSRWQDQEPVIPTSPQEIPDFRLSDQLEEKRAELSTTCGSQAPSMDVSVPGPAQFELPESRHQSRQHAASKLPEIGLNFAPVQAPVAINPAHGWSQSSCSSNWARCSDSQCPVSACSSFSSISESQTSGSMGEKNQEHPSSRMMMEPGRMCASPPPMDGDMGPSQEQGFRKIPANTPLLELPGSAVIPGLPSMPYTVASSSEMDFNDILNSSCSDAHASFFPGGGETSECSPPPSYCLALGGVQAPHLDQQLMTAAIQTPPRTVTEDSNTLTFNSGYATEPHSSAPIISSSPPTKCSVLPTENPLPSRAFPASLLSLSRAETQALHFRCLELGCTWTPLTHGKPENFPLYRQRHMKTHKNQMYGCPVQHCFKTMTRRDNLRKHVKKNHAEYDIEEVMLAVRCTKRDPTAAAGGRKMASLKRRTRKAGVMQSLSRIGGGGGGQSL